MSNKRDLNKIFYDDNEYAISIFRIVQAFAREKGYTLNRRQLATDIVKMMNFEIELLQVIIFFLRKKNYKLSH